LPRSHHISICLLGFESQKAHPDLGRDSGFWLRINAEDAAPLIDVFKTSPAVFHEFLIQQRVGKEIRTSRLSAQIVKIEEGPETRILIRPDPQGRGGSKGTRLLNHLETQLGFLL
jgi:hypothetical protein